MLSIIEESTATSKDLLSKISVSKYLKLVSDLTLLDCTLEFSKTEATMASKSHICSAGFLSWLTDDMSVRRNVGYSDFYSLALSFIDIIKHIDVS